MFDNICMEAGNNEKVGIINPVFVGCFFFTNITQHHMQRKQMLMIKEQSIYNSHKLVQGLGSELCGKKTIGPRTL